MEQVQEKKIYTLEELKKLSLQELQKIGRELELSRVTGLRKEELIEKILTVQAKEEGLNFVKGVLEILPESYGFIRSS
ncbi:MAG: Rho termination factor N-terminal domain-containing protein, partial [Aquificaceae bacterium]